MNWFDFVIIGIVVIGAIVGMRIGIIGAAFTAAGGVIGFLLAGQLSDDIGGLFDSSIAGDTWVTVVSYVVIIGLTIVASGFVWRIARPFVTIATLGASKMMDKLGGMALGLVVGVAIAGALIVVAARFTYNFELPDDKIPGALSSAAKRFPDAETKEALENALAGSGIVGAFTDVVDAIPGRALGFVPADFQFALEILELRPD